MSVKAYVGDKFTCLSTDTKPTNVDSGANLFELDTLKHFLKVGEDWHCLNCTTNSNLIGPTGPTGPPGSVGPRGEGLIGKKGERGFSVTGPTGEQGERGEKGLSSVVPYYWWGESSSVYDWGKWILYRNPERFDTIQEVGTHIFWNITWSGKIEFINSASIKLIICNSTVTLTEGEFIFNGQTYRSISLTEGEYEFISTPAGILVLNSSLYASIVTLPAQLTGTLPNRNIDSNPYISDALAAVDFGAYYGIAFEELMTQYVVRTVPQTL